MCRSVIAAAIQLRNAHAMLGTALPAPDWALRDLYEAVAEHEAEGARLRGVEGSSDPNHEPPSR